MSRKWKERKKGQDLFLAKTKVKIGRSLDRLWVPLSGKGPDRLAVAK